MRWQDLSGHLLLAGLVVTLVVPVLGRRFALAYFETRLAVLENEGALYRIANFDSLTGVANGHRLMERPAMTLLAARRKRESLAIFFIDVNGLKCINDRNGHAAGDAVLIQVSQRLSHWLRDEELLARYGGDDFVLVTEPEHAEVDTRDGRSIGVLMEVADRAMYQDKRHASHA